MTTMNDDHHDQKNQPRKKNTPKIGIKCRSSSNEAFPREQNAALSIYQRKSW